MRVRAALDAGWEVDVVAKRKTGEPARIWPRA
jgi:hypothetical protein